MAKYLNNKSKQRAVNLCKNKDFGWEIEAIDSEDIEEAREEKWIAIVPPVSDFLDGYFEDVNPLYPDLFASYAKYVKLYYKYADDDVFKQHPLATYITYPAFEPSGSEDVPDDEFEREVSLSKKEIMYFSELLRDKHLMAREKYLEGVIPHIEWLSAHEEYVKNALDNMKDYFRMDDFVRDYKASASETVLKNILADSWRDDNYRSGEFESNVARLLSIPYEDVVDYRTEKFWEEIENEQR